VLLDIFFFFLINIYHLFCCFVKENFECGTQSVSPSSVILNNAELCSIINRDISRIFSVFKLPLTLSGALSLPEAVVLNMVCYNFVRFDYSSLFLSHFIYLCFCFKLAACVVMVLDLWQLPFAFVSFVALNGSMSYYLFL
jgi:hypothetical protein